MRKPAHNALPAGEAAFNSLYRTYNRSAIGRDLLFTLTKEQFRSISKSPCHYCGSLPQTQHPTARNVEYRAIQGKPISPYVYNGVDRRDPTVGYVWDNCLPCCQNCNYAKLDLGYTEFLEMIERIYINRIKG